MRSLLKRATLKTPAESATYQPITPSTTGATSPTRYVGGTADLAPVAGTFAVGDFVVSATAKVWVCTVAGTPGSWTQTTTGAAGPTGPADLRGVDLLRGTAPGTTGFAAFDTMQRGDSAVSIGVPDSGNAYTTHGGTLGISSNKAYAVADVESGAWLDAGVTDCIVGADFYVGDALADHGLHLNLADINNRLVAVIVGAGDLLLGKLVAGTFTQIASFTHAWTVGQTYRLEVRITRSRMDFYVNGVRMTPNGGVYFLTSGEVTAFKANTKFGFYTKRSSWRISRFFVRQQGRIIARSDDIEHRMTLGPASGTPDNFSTNVAAVQHLNPVGISATRYVAHDDVEKTAFGWGNSGGDASLPYFGAAFWEVSDVIQGDGSAVSTNAPPPMRRVTTGVISSRYDSYLREEVVNDGTVQWFDIYATFSGRKAIMKLDQIAKRLYTPAPASAPAGAALIASQVSFYLDESGNNLKAIVKYADGTTVKTATMALV